MTEILGTVYNHDNDLAVANARGVDPHTITMMDAIYWQLMALGNDPAGTDLDTFQYGDGGNVMSIERYFELKNGGKPEDPMFHDLIQEYHRQIHWRLAEAPLASESEAE